MEETVLVGVIEKLTGDGVSADEASNAIKTLQNLHNTNPVQCVEVCLHVLASSSGSRPVAQKLALAATASHSVRKIAHQLQNHQQPPPTTQWASIFSGLMAREPSHHVRAQLARGWAVCSLISSLSFGDDALALCVDAANRDGLGENPICMLEAVTALGENAQVAVVLQQQRQQQQRQQQQQQQKQVVIECSDACAMLLVKLFCSALQQQELQKVALDAIAPWLSPPRENISLLKLHHITTPFPPHVTTPLLTAVLSVIVWENVTPQICDAATGVVECVYQNFGGSANGVSEQVASLLGGVAVQVLDWAAQQAESKQPILHHHLSAVCRIAQAAAQSQISRFGAIQTKLEQSFVLQSSLSPTTHIAHMWLDCWDSLLSSIGAANLNIDPVVAQIKVFLQNIVQTMSSFAASNQITRIEDVGEEFFAFRQSFFEWLHDVTDGNAQMLQAIVTQFHSFLHAASEAYKQSDPNCNTAWCSVELCLAALMALEKHTNSQQLGGIVECVTIALEVPIPQSDTATSGVHNLIATRNAWFGCLSRWLSTQHPEFLIPIATQLALGVSSSAATVLIPSVIATNKICIHNSNALALQCVQWPEATLVDVCKRRRALLGSLHQPHRQFSMYQLLFAALCRLALARPDETTSAQAITALTTHCAQTLTVAASGLPGSANCVGALLVIDAELDTVEVLARTLRPIGSTERGVRARWTTASNDNAAQQHHTTHPLVHALQLVLPPLISVVSWCTANPAPAISRGVLVKACNVLALSVENAKDALHDAVSTLVSMGCEGFSATKAGCFLHVLRAVVQHCTLSNEQMQTLCGPLFGAWMEFALNQFVHNDWNPAVAVEYLGLIGCLCERVPAENKEFTQHAVSQIQGVVQTIQHQQRQLQQQQNVLPTPHDADPWICGVLQCIPKIVLRVPLSQDLSAQLQLLVCVFHLLDCGVANNHLKQSADAILAVRTSCSAEAFRALIHLIVVDTKQHTQRSLKLAAHQQLATAVLDAGMQQQPLCKALKRFYCR